MNTIEKRLLTLVNTEFNKKKNPNVTLDSHFRKDLGLDSLSMTELIIACEELFEIEIDVDQTQATEVKTLRPLFDAVCQLTESPK